MKFLCLPFWCVLNILSFFQVKVIKFGSRRTYIKIPDLISTPKQFGNGGICQFNRKVNNLNLLYGRFILDKMRKRLFIWNTIKFEINRKFESFDVLKGTMTNDINKMKKFVSRRPWIKFVICYDYKIQAEEFEKIKTNSDENNMKVEKLNDYVVKLSYIPKITY